MQTQGVTVSVSDLARSKAFYEPTRWQSYKFDGRAYLAIIEVPDFQRQASADMINFDVNDIEALWRRVGDKTTVEAELAETPWGSYKFVIQDPDGYRLGFVGKA